jgi:nitrogen fixation protein FixH
MSARTRWIAAILGLLGANVLGVVILIATSSANASQIIPQYDDRAARFQVVLDEAEASRALAWQATVTATVSSIDVIVRDRTGAPLDGAAVRIQGFHRAHAAAALDLALAPIAPGHFRITAPLLAGVYDLRVVVERGGARFAEPIVAEVR